MKTRRIRSLATLITLLGALALTACTSTRQSDGVTIEQNRASNWGNAIGKLWPW